MPSAGEFSLPAAQGSPKAKQGGNREILCYLRFLLFKNYTRTVQLPFSKADSLSDS